MAQSPSSKKLVIPSELPQAVRVEQMILDQVQAQGYSEQVRFAIRLALDEALSNAINHGNQGDPTKEVTIEFQVTEQQVQVTICDQGPGFDPHGVPDPTLDENLQCPSGRGVMLMMAYMTEVRFNDKGNCVTMIKRADCPLPEKKQ